MPDAHIQPHGGISPDEVNATLLQLAKFSGLITRLSGRFVLPREKTSTTKSLLHSPRSALAPAGTAAMCFGSKPSAAP